MQILSLNGSWNIENLDTKVSCIGCVPGSVISAFVEQGIFEDPYYGTNEYKIREEMRYRYQFWRHFTIEDERVLEKEVELICYGIDTLATVYLNGSKIGYANNMHRIWRFSCKDSLQLGENKIKLVFDSPITYIENYQPEEGKEITFVSHGVMGGNQYIRKAHSMFGWDWGAMLPDIGIWRSIELQIHEGIRFDEAYISQVHKDGQVALQVEVNVKGNAVESIIPAYLLKQQNIYRIKICLEGNGVSDEVEIPLKRQVSHTFLVTNPKLWWPNGYGEQSLYKVSIQCITNEQEVIDQKQYDIGLRTITISQEKDAWGNEFAFVVNGIKIFIKGANYIPEDCMYSMITKERLEYLTDCAIDANFNCLRVWGGGYYPSDEFYECCDKKGLLVWQDLMYACNIYDLTKEFKENIVEEAYDNVMRLRHHACLALWCGNNEIESAWESWGDFKDHSKKLRADYIKMFEYILPKAIKQEDRETFYWPSSPSSGGSFDNPDNKDKGDVHYWEVWHGLKPFEEYKKHYFRFCSEFGFQSFPCLKTVKTYADNENLNIFSKVMESHQKNQSANGKILYYLSEHFLYPKDFDSLLYISQILQGLAIKAGVEHWRNHRGRCMGALYWQFNDNWPVASWSSIDYYGRWKALHYMAKKFYAPLHGTMDKEKDIVTIYLQNETLKDEGASITLRLKTMDFRVVHSYSVEALVDALSSNKVVTFDYSELVKELEEQLEEWKEELFLECEIQFLSGYRVVQTEVFVPYKHVKLQKPIYQKEVEEQENGYIIRISADTFAPFVEVQCTLFDGIFSDNYFDITSKEEYEVFIAKKHIRNDLPNDQTLYPEDINVRSLYDSYMN